MMKKWFQSAVLLMAVSTLSACATKELLSQGGSTTKIVEQGIAQDHVIAFGRPAQVLQGMPADAIVIVGKQNSYVLSEGGGQFSNLISKLDPRYIRVTNGLRLFSANNDGRFVSQLSLRYSRIKSDFSKADIDFFLQNNVRECTHDSEIRMNVQSFCFDIPLAGAIYPAVSNQGSLRPLSKPYPIEVYTKVEQTQQHPNKVGKKIALFPFAVAFDVITLPFQAIGEIFD